MSETPAGLLLQWYDRVKRDLPWRGISDPYRVWLSEIMLQQTRVETVKGYYERFLTLFPTVEALAAAPREAVLKAWEGLGYYSRARNLHKAAQAVASGFAGRFPQSYEELARLPGVGPYTAGAIASIAFGERVPAVDGNVLRVASRFFGVRADIAAPGTRGAIRALVQDAMPPERAGDYNQALMELGATVCSPLSPNCGACPWEALCDARAEGDAESLPIHEKKRPPKKVDVAVCLLTRGDRVLVTRRKERLLHGLYVFALLEEETEPERVRQLLLEQGLDCSFASALGSARHAFTHRVWDMRLLHYRLDKSPDAETLDALGARMADAAALAALPLPAAMRAAREAALSLLTREGR